jgi:predicted outer membrane repeat protein
MKYWELTKLTLISILISIPVVLSSQTNVTGEVYGVWDKNNSPYLINSNITVPNGSSLVIEPGVEVQFMGHYKFSINGTLSAIGTSTEMIHFTVADTSGWSNRYTNAGGWGGLKFDRTQSSDTSKIEYCKFEYGKAMGDGWEEVKAGGAIFIDGFSKIRIQNTVFTKNWAQWYGGAIYCEGANPVFENLLIYRNQAERNGGGICIESHSSAQPDLFNLTITENISQKGGGIYCDWGCSPNIINTIIWNNSAENGAQIFLSEVNADPNFINCIIEGGKTGFEGNGANFNFNGKFQNCMMNDPLFVNPEAFNFQLQKNSHGINTGSLHSLNRIPNYDITGNNRVYGDSIDIGVYEYQELPMNRIPVLEDLPDLQTNVDTPIEFNLSFYDPDLEDVHEVVISSDVPGTEIVKMNDQYNSAKYKVIPPTEWRGTITITAKVVDNENQTSILNTKTFHIKVSNTFEAGGDIIENTIWNSDTISVNSNIIIHDDVLLQIAAGTIVEFQGDYNIKVEGTILAIGNENDSITFCPKNNLTNWSGVKLVNDSGDAMSDNDSTKFINCIFTGV